MGSAAASFVSGLGVVAGRANERVACVVSVDLVGCAGHVGLRDTERAAAVAVDEQIADVSAADG